MRKKKKLFLWKIKRKRRKMKRLRDSQMFHKEEYECLLLFAEICSLMMI